MIAGCSVAGGAEGFVAVVVVVVVVGGTESFGDTFLADFVDHQCSPLVHAFLYFCKWGNAGLLRHHHGVGDCCNFGLFFCFDGGVGVGTGVGGIGQSFLVSNRFSEADPALDQGVPCTPGALRISSSGRGLSFRDLVVGCRTSANCPLLSLCTVTGIDSAVDLTTDVCVLRVATVGAGAVEVGVEDVGWVSLYHLLAIMVFLLLLVTFVLGPGDFLTLGLVFGWAGLGWFGCIWIYCGWVQGWGLDLGPSLPSNFRYIFIFWMREG